MISYGIYTINSQYIHRNSLCDDSGGVYSTIVYRSYRNDDNGMIKDVCDVVMGDYSYEVVGDDKLGSGSISIRNSAGDVRVFDVKDIDGMVRFVRPPIVLRKDGGKRWMDIVRSINNDNNDIILYIYLPDLPKESIDYKKHYLYDTNLFTSCEEKFRQLSYKCNRSTQCVIIKDQSLGKELGLSEINFGDVFVVRNENVQLGMYSNDNRYNMRLVWSKISNYSDINHTDARHLLNKVYERVFYINSMNDVNRYISRGSNKRDMIVIYSHEEKENKIVEKIRKLDTALDKSIDILCVSNRDILQRYYNIIPDNYIETVRYIKRREDEIELNESFINKLYCDSEKRWIKVNNEKRESVDRHYNMKLDVDDIIYTVERCNARGGTNTLNRREIKEHLESGSQVSIKYSRQVDSDMLQSLVNSSNYSIVKFYRDNCIACDQLHSPFEQLATIVKSKERLKGYNIKHMDRVYNMNVCSFDMSTDIDDENIEVHKTPTIMILGNGSIHTVDLMKEKFDISDTDRIIYKLLRSVDSI